MLVQQVKAIMKALERSSTKGVLRIGRLKALVVLESIRQASGRTVDGTTSRAFISIRTARSWTWTATILTRMGTMSLVGIMMMLMSTIRLQNPNTMNSLAGEALWLGRHQVALATEEISLKTWTSTGMTRIMRRDDGRLLVAVEVAAAIKMNMTTGTCQEEVYLNTIALIGFTIVLEAVVAETI